jgi:multiple sugar transport system permease protein
MFSPSILVLPLYQVFSTLGLLDTIWSIVLGHLAWVLPFSTLLLHSFLEEFSKEVEEAAQLDGLGVWGIFWKIVFPLLAPAVGVVGIFAFASSWGEFLFAVSFSRTNIRTGPVQISLTISEYRIWWVCLLHQEFTGLFPQLFWQFYLIDILQEG